MKFQQDAQDKLNSINTAISSGRAVRISNRMSNTDWTPNTVNSFRRSGFEPFVVEGNSLMMLKGKNYLCIDFCGIQFSN